MADAPTIREFTGGKSAAFRDHLNELVNPVNKVIREFNERERLRPFDDGPIYVAYILITATETGVGYYKATVLQWQPIGIDPTKDIKADALGGTVGEKVCAMLHSDLGESNHTLDPGADGIYALAHLTGAATSDGRRVVAVIAGGSGGGGLRLFSLSQSGGSAGNASSPCSFTYDVYDYVTGDLLGSGVALTGNGRRDVAGEMEPGGIGWGKVLPGGSIALVYADEKLTITTCNPDSTSASAAFGF